MQLSGAGVGDFERIGDGVARVSPTIYTSIQYASFFQQHGGKHIQRCNFGIGGRHILGCCQIICGMGIGRDSV